jgi:hypothetical protein
MKNLSRITSIMILLLMNHFMATSQNYQSISSGFTRFYRNDHSGIVLPVKTDSAVSQISGDSALYFFRIIRDTSSQYGGCAVDTAAPCWTGTHSILKINGDNLFFSKQGDTILFKTHAFLGNRWKFVQKEGYYFEATLASIEYSEINGIFDSIKVISLQAYDNTGHAIQDWYNSKTFKLSKNNGFSGLYNLYEFPADTNLYKSFSTNILSIGEVYDFEPGDIFHIKLGGPDTPPNYNIITILSKWSSQNNDTIFYLQKRQTYSNTVVWDPNPHIVTTYNLDTNTVFYIHPDDLISTLMPHQKNNKFFHDLSYYDLSSHNNNWNGRTTMIFNNSWNYMFDSQLNCFTAAFEPVYDFASYTKGCGTSDISHDDPAENYEWYNTLVYYKKGSEIWGDPYILTSVASNISAIPFFEVSPNPFSNTINVRLETLSAGKISLGLYSVTGQLITQIEDNYNQPGIHSYNPDLSALPKGVYILVFKTAESIRYKKLIRN